MKNLKRFSTLGFACAAALLAACSGSNSTGSPVASLVPQALAPAAKNLCAATGKGYVFHGSCWQGTLAASGAAASLAAYKGNTVTMKFGKNDAPGAAIAVLDAIGKHDITGTVSGKKFMPYVGFGSPVIYFDFKNGSPKNVDFPKTPEITIAVGRPFNSSVTCGLGFLTGTQWVIVPSLSGQVTPSKVVYPAYSVRKQKTTIPANGDLFGVAWCNGY